MNLFAHEILQIIRSRVETLEDAAQSAARDAAFEYARNNDDEESKSGAIRAVAAADAVALVCDQLFVTIREQMEQVGQKVENLASAEIHHRGERDAAIAELEKFKAEHVRAVTEATVDYSRVIGEREELRAEVDRLIAERDEAAADCERLRDELAKLRIDRDNAIQNVGIELEEARAEVEKLKAEHAAQLDKLQSDFDQLQAKLYDLTSQRDEAVKLKDAIREERNTRVAERDRLEFERNELRDEVAQLIAEREGEIANIKQSQADLAAVGRDAIAERDRLRVEVENLQAERERQIGLALDAAEKLRKAEADREHLRELAARYRRERNAARAGAAAADSAIDNAPAVVASVVEPQAKPSPPA